MQVLTVADKIRNEVVSKICFMYSSNTGLEINRENYETLSEIVDLLESKRAKIMSPKYTNLENMWVIAKTDAAGNPIIKNNVCELGAIVYKGQPFEKELIDTFFAVLRSNNVTQTMEALKNSPLTLNFG